MGPRLHAGRAGLWLVLIGVAWSVFQLWIASPLPERFGVLMFNQATIRSVHLAFAVLLTFLAYPASRRSALDEVPGVDVVLAVLAALSAGFLAIFYASISEHTGQNSWPEIATAAMGMVLLLEATRRVLGWPMVLLALVLFGYIFFGAYMPDLIAHKGVSFGRTMAHMWLTTQGVFGGALGISAGLIFLFVLFGALLETAGASSYFIRCAVALVGHRRGGPAKAAVLASVATGMLSGSSITNVVTTGPLTIPLIKRVGYSPEKAAAVEVAASVNGQVMPPVMSAAAFLIVEYVGVPYIQVLKHALISALVSYLGLLYIVHLEAVKANLQGLPRSQWPSWQRRVDQFLLGFFGLATVLVVVSLVGSVLHMLVPQSSFLIMAVLMLVAYLALLRAGAHHGTTAELDVESPIKVVPKLGATLRSGMHFLLPLAALIWNLLVEQLSPERAAFWATMFLIFIVLTQRPLLAWFRAEGRHAMRASAWQGAQDLLEGLAAGARNMVIVAVATATAGIVVGTLSLTGVGLVMTELVGVLSGSNIIVMLVLVALICLVLGMGLPTTASYIVVSSLLAPVIVNIGAQNGLLIPLIAAHLFVFYFGLMADITPPIGLASYAAASIAHANPIRTGVVAFRYSMRMALLPFMFVLNPQLLLIGVTGVFHTLLTVASATLAGFAFISVNQGWLLLRSTVAERLVMLVAVFMLFYPGLFMDRLFEPYVRLSGSAAQAAIVAAPPGINLRIYLKGTTLEGEAIERGVVMTFGDLAETAADRLSGSGIESELVDGTLTVTKVEFGSRAEKLRIQPGYELSAVEVRSDSPPREWMFLPALLLIGGVALRQQNRRALSLSATEPGPVPQ